MHDDANKPETHDKLSVDMACILRKIQHDFSNLNIQFQMLSFTVIGIIIFFNALLVNSFIFMIKYLHSLKTYYKLSYFHHNKQNYDYFMVSQKINNDS